MIHSQDITEDVVFIVNVVDHDYESIMQYSVRTPVIITEGYVPTASWDRVSHAIGIKLEESRPQDYLAISGMNSLCAIAVALWFRKHNFINLLLWDKKLQRYRLKRIDGNGDRNDQEES